jgi:hypothetical protein
MMKKIAVLSAAIVVLIPAAWADVISIGFQEAGFNGGAITTVATGSGNAAIMGAAYGTFSVLNVSAEDFTDLGGPGLLNTQTLDISSSIPGALTIWVTAQGASATSALNLISAFAVNELEASVVSTRETTYISKGNALYGGTVISSALFSGIGTAGPLTVSSPNPGSLYSITEQYTVFDVGTAAGNNNLTINLSSAAAPTPEAATLLLLGSGILVSGGLLRLGGKKRHAA